MFNDIVILLDNNLRIAQPLYHVSAEYWHMELYHIGFISGHPVAYIAYVR